MTDKIMCIDVESNGLWGEPISIGFSVEENGVVKDFGEAYYISDNIEYNDWIKENVIKFLKNDSEALKCNSYLELLKWFADKYYEYKKEDYVIVYHMGSIVESNLFRELVKHDLVGIWDAPYTPIELSVMLDIAGFKPDSVDYLVENNIIEKPSTGVTHQALYDAMVCGKVYWYLKDLLEKRIDINKVV